MVWYLGMGNINQTISPFWEVESEGGKMLELQGLLDRLPLTI